MYVTRRLKKDGSEYFGPYFPANLAYRITDFIHRHFLIPSCNIDLRRYHPRPCLQYYIGRCLGPCVKGMVTPERYGEAVNDVRLFLQGKQTELARSLTRAWPLPPQPSSSSLPPSIATYLYRRATSGQTTHCRSRRRRRRRVRLSLRKWHACREPLPHSRRKILDRREFFWDKMPSLEEGKFEAGEFFSSLLMQLYLGQQYVPQYIYLPVDFEDRPVLEEVLTELTRTHRDSGPAAWRQTLAHRPGWQQRQAILRSALPRLEAQRGNHRPALQDALTWQSLRSNRMLRHLAHPGR